MTHSEIIAAVNDAANYLHSLSFEDRGTNHEYVLARRLRAAAEEIEGRGTHQASHAATVVTVEIE